MKKWIALFSLCILAVLFRKALMLAFFKIAIVFSIGGKETTLTYENMEWEGDCIRMDQVAFADKSVHIVMDQVRISLSGSFLSWKAHCQILHPQAYLKPNLSSEREGIPLFFVRHLRFVDLSWEISEGVLQLNDSHPPLYFSFLPPESADGLGKMALSYEPDKESAPLFFLELREKDAGLNMHFSLKEENLSRLIPLACKWIPVLNQEWQNLEGTIEVIGDMCLTEKGTPMELCCQWEAHGLNLTSTTETISVRANHCRGDLALLGKWQLEKAHVLLEEGYCSISPLFPYQVSIDKAEISREAARAPEIAVHGVCESSGISFPFALLGTGEYHDDDAFILDLHAALGNVPESSMHLDASVCRFETGKYAVECNCADLLWEHVHFLSLLLPEVWQEQWKKGKDLPFPIHAHTTLKQEPKDITIEADLLFGEEKLSIGAHFDRKKQETIFSEGWFEAEDLTEGTYSSFLQALPLSLPLKGKLSLTGNFDPSYLVIAAQGTQCRLDYPWGTLAFPSFGEEGVELIYSFKEKKLKGEISLQEAQVAAGKWSLHSLTTKILLDGNTLEIPSFSAVSEGIALQGKMGELCLDNAAKRLHVKKVVAEGVIPDLGLLKLCVPQGSWEWAGQKLLSLECDLENDKKRVLSLKAKALQAGNGEWEISFDPQELRFFNAPIPITRLKVKTEAAWEGFTIEECRTDALSFRARCQLEKSALKISDWEGVWRGIQIQAAGVLDFHTREYSVTLDALRGDFSALPISPLPGQFAAHGSLKGPLSAPWQFQGEGICTLSFAGPVSLTAWNNKPFKISCPSPNSYCLEDLGLYLKNAKEGSVVGVLSLGKLDLQVDRKEYKGSQCQLTLSPQMLRYWADVKVVPALIRDVACEGKVEASGEFHYGQEGLTCHMAMKDGKYGFKGHSLSLQQIGIHCQRGVFTLQAKTQVGESALWGALNVSLTKNAQGIIRITDNPRLDGIRLHFKLSEDQLQWEKVHGQCAGLNCSLEKGDGRRYPAADVLTGHVSIDASQLIPFFPSALKEKIAPYKIGKGYSWQGDCVLWRDARRGFQITGEIKGEEWELLDYRFKRLRAGVDIHPASILLTNVQIEDDAGSIQVKKIGIDKKEERWELSIPLISIREWLPSSMRKCDLTQSAAKPFLLRNFTLTGIHAYLGQKESLEGQGRLTFTNSFKKESTLWDAPLELIKNFGLDPGLLTPVQGEIEIDLRGDKMYLVSLKDAFSDGKRAEFYLAPGKRLSYIDLDGKMHIDLKMRQEVTLKLTEPFLLTIRGSLENPRYGLQLAR
ncbi:MAG TPA: hypothetical protein VGJ00_10575 [Rhabdochlamydiaceae bacterium]|jgi:hypothetical protein